MAFGVLAVNKYYGYYQTWGSVVADFSHQDASAASQVPEIEFAARARAGTLDGSRRRAWTGHAGISSTGSRRRPG